MCLFPCCGQECGRCTIVSRLQNGSCCTVFTLLREIRSAEKLFGFVYIQSAVYYCVNKADITLIHEYLQHL